MNRSLSSMPTPGDALARLSMSIPARLLESLDIMIEERALPSRSSLIVELIRDALGQYAQMQHPDAVIAGSITLVYGSVHGTVRHKIAHTQRDFLKEVISSQHVFLEQDQSLEILLVQGPPARLNALCDILRSIRGVREVQLVTTTALLPPLYEPAASRSDMADHRAA
jgi:CopG family transcriptional regulator, nickel-responsive regulator